MKNVTFSLPDELMENIRELAKARSIKSINQFVREALEEYIKEQKRIKIEQAMQRAVNDPLFAADVSECENAFSGIEYKSVFTDAEVVKLKKIVKFLMLPEIVDKFKELKEGRLEYNGEK